RTRAKTKKVMESYGYAGSPRYGIPEFTKNRDVSYGISCTLTAMKTNDYEWLFRKAPVMASSIGRDGHYLDVNDAFCKRLGLSREEMIGRRPAEFVTGESAERIEKEF